MKLKALHTVVYKDKSGHVEVKPGSVFDIVDDKEAAFLIEAGAAIEVKAKAKAEEKPEAKVETKTKAASAADDMV